MTAYAGIFETADKAQSAVHKLRAKNFNVDDVLSLKPAKGAELERAMDSAFEDGFVTGMYTAIWRTLESGKAVVLVKAALGKGKLAEVTLKESGAAEVVEGSPPRPQLFSDTIGMPLLSSKKPNASVIRKPFLSSMLGMATVTTPKAGRKSTFGIPLLTKAATPLSSLLGIPLTYDPRKKNKD
jgi:hypothetical protein